MNVLVACEFSGVVRDAFIRRGHDAVSCDILPGQGEFSQHHIQEDVRTVLARNARRRRPDRYHLLIAHPPCTYLCNSGVRWLYGGKGTEIDAARWQAMEQGAEFFNELWYSGIPRVCIENPVMHGHAAQRVAAQFTQSIQPWQFGHGEVKRTCLWLKDLPLLRPTNIVQGREPKVHHMSPGKDRGLLRSITYQGIADAMADQWGTLS